MSENWGPPAGMFAWNELMTRDVPAAKKFYGEVLGWTLVDQPMPMGFDYTVAMIGEKPVAGIMDMNVAKMPESVPAHWFSYIAVDDADAHCEAVTAAGGTVKNPAFDVPKVGRIAILMAPDGSVYGVLQAAAADEADPAAEETA